MMSPMTRLLAAAAAAWPAATLAQSAPAPLNPETMWQLKRIGAPAISPDGSRILTFHILTDGLGPGEIHLRTTSGRKLATYTTNWFSDWGCESPDTLLLDVNGQRKFATVRCTLASCENATDPVKVSAP